MRRSDMFDTRRYWKHGELAEPKVRTIDYVSMEELKDIKSGNMVHKPVVTFADDPRQLVLNPTNYDSIADFSNKWDTDEWPGMQVELYAATETNMNGEEYQCVRVRKASGSPEQGSGPPPKLTPKPASKPVNDDFNDNIPF